MSEQSAYTFSSRTDLTSVAMKMNNDSRGLCRNAEPFAMSSAEVDKSQIQLTIIIYHDKM